MAYSGGGTYVGSWARRTQQDRDAPLKPPLDPEHAQPTDQQYLGGMNPTWVSNSVAPGLPVDMIGPDQTMGMPTGLGPVDMTPEDHLLGVGVGPGLDTLQSMDKMGPYHELDFGAGAAHRWQHMTDRDGTGPHLEVMQDPIGAGASPQTLLLEESGVGVVSDGGNSRRGRWFKRWWDRPIDMHRFDPAMRPAIPRYAIPVQPQAAVAGGNQYNGEYATYAGTNPRLGVSDRFVTPLVRRIPGPWDAPLASDGTNDTVAGTADQYGLTRFGL